MLEKWKRECLLRFSASAMPKRDKRVLQQRDCFVSVLVCKGLKLRHSEEFQGTVLTNFMDTGHVVIDEFDESMSMMRKSERKTKQEFIDLWNLKKLFCFYFCMWLICDVLRSKI